MSPLFGKRREEGKTILLLDVETGSVGAALAHFISGEQPRLFAETRRQAPLLSTHDTDALARQVLRAAESALTHVAEVAARMRGHPTLAPLGKVEHAVAFLSPPWGALTISDRALDTHPLVYQLQKNLEALFGPVSLTAESFGLMAAHTAPMVFPHDEHYLLSTISGEVTELILLENVGSHLKIAAHATLPLGHHYPLRTLLAHNTISLAEARSALRLGARGHAPARALEALHTAEAHFVSEFSSVAGELLQHAPARRVVVVGGEPAGEWFARSLAQDSIVGHLFPEMGEVRAVRPANVSAFLSMHSRRPDLPLLLEGLFVNTRFTSVV